MKKKNASYLYYLAAFCLFIAAFVGGTTAFYPVGLCMLILGIMNQSKK